MDLITISDWLGVAVIIKRSGSKVNLSIGEKAM